MSTERDYDWDDGDCFKVAFAVGRSRRYHAKMHRFYEAMHDGVIAVNAVLGAGAFVALIGGKTGSLATVLTGILAAASALDTTFGWSRKAKLHADLTRRFTDLAARMIEKPATSASYRWACAERIRIEKDEPPIRRLVDLQAQNEESRSLGVDPAYQIQLTRRQRIFGYIFTFGMTRLQREDDARQLRRRELEDAEANQAENSAST